jgi:oligopeptide/dipeptide ABC transporter ATP-binding protein
MYLGRIVELAPVEELYRSARHPYATALLSAVPLPDPDAVGKRERIVLAGDVPSPILVPRGCRFHPRCPKARDQCVLEDPVLAPRLGDGPEHLAACHFPVADGEDITRSRPNISVEERVIEPGVSA